MSIVLYNKGKFVTQTFIRYSTSFNDPEQLFFYRANVLHTMVFFTQQDEKDRAK